MTATILTLLCVLLIGATWALRRSALSLTRESLREIRSARTRGSAKARLQYPAVDLSQCIGCGACIKACPEEGVLAMVHGQALVAHGSRCVGHALCADACPTSAIAVTLGDLSDRDDMPAVDESLESTTQPGLFLAGEITGYALIRTAIRHGSAVASEIARRCQAESSAPDVFDVVIVGAGPAGLSCALQAKSEGLRYAVLERDRIGGTVAHYPRRKLVMTSPVELPGYGRLKRSSYSKEELIDIWTDVIESEDIEINPGEEFTGLEHNGDVFEVATKSGPNGEALTWRAKHVVMAIGRRGTPRRLGVPGEDSSKVAYSLIDSSSYQGRRVLVVGGGDSAVEAAIGLSKQPGNQVTLSYRRNAFNRIKARNEVALAEATQSGSLDILYGSTVEAIDDGSVKLSLRNEDPVREVELGNDDVFVMAGGIPPFDLLKASGVSFDPDDHPSADAEVVNQRGLTIAIAATLALAIGAVAWLYYLADYYELSNQSKPLHELHDLLAPGAGLGLVCGLAGTACIVFNLAYLLRRARIGRRIWGSLRAWMTSHIITGFAAMFLLLVHAGGSVRDTNGGHAFVALVVVVVAGVLGRYLYACVPRAANGRELAIEEVRSQLDVLTGRLDRQASGLREEIERELVTNVVDARWQKNIPGILGGIFGARRKWLRLESRLREHFASADLADEQVAELLGLSRNVFRSAWQAKHLETLRGMLGSWRWVHRWLALLMIGLAIIHIVTAARFGFLGGRG